MEVVRNIICHGPGHVLQNLDSGVAGALGDTQADHGPWHGLAAAVSFGLRGGAVNVLEGPRDASKTSSRHARAHWAVRCVIKLDHAAFIVNFEAGGCAGGGCLANPGLSCLVDRRVTTAWAPVEDGLRVRFVGITLFIVAFAIQLA